MKTCTMSTLMIKAIERFDRLFPNAEIRKIEPLEGSMKGEGYTSVTFGISYYENNENQDCSIVAIAED